MEGGWIKERKGWSRKGACWRTRVPIRKDEMIAKAHISAEIVPLAVGSSYFDCSAKADARKDGKDSCCSVERGARGGIREGEAAVLVPVSFLLLFLRFRSDESPAVPVTAERGDAAEQGTDRIGRVCV